MATGASTADLAVMLVDARKGILRQTRRHSYIASLLGIRHVVLAVNKIDLVDYDEAVFDAIVADYQAFAEDLGFATIQPIPISARYGDNVTERLGRMPWYDGPTLLDHLETIAVEIDRADRPFRLPVQWVNRPNLDFRGFCGRRSRPASDRRGRPGRRSPSPAARPGSKRHRHRRTGPATRPCAGEAVTLVLADEVDVSRGDMLAAPDDRAARRRPVPGPRDLDRRASPMLPGRSYILRTETRTASARR